MPTPVDANKIAGDQALVVSQGGKVQAIYEIEPHNGFYHIFIARRDNATHEFVYAGTASSLSIAAGFIDRSIARGYAGSQRTMVQEQRLLDFTGQQHDMFDIQIKPEGKSALDRAKAHKPDTGHDKRIDKQKKESSTDDKTIQQDRVETKQADNDRTENLTKNKTDDSPAQDNNSRVEQEKPQTEEPVDNSLGGKAEKEVNEFFGGGQQAANVLKGELEDYVLEGGNPIVAALGATGLDALNLAMGFAQNTAIGLLDTRNLGQGIKKGTFEGVKEDAARVLNILPQGRVARVLGIALTVSDLTEAAMNHDASGFAVTGGFAALTAIAGKGGKGKKNQKQTKSKSKPPSKSKAPPKKVPKSENYEHGIDPHTVTDIVKNQERHHAVLQALFRRLDDEVLASFIHEGPSHPIKLKLHQKIHRELNEMLRQEGFLERRGQPRTKLSPGDFKQALQKIEQFYRDKAIQYPNSPEIGEMRDTVKTFRRTLENIGLI